MAKITIYSDDEVYKFTSQSYSEKNIYSRSVDSKGHQRQVRVNAPPNLVHSISQVCKDLGYSSVEAFFRDAAVHRLRYWQKEKPNNEQLAFYNSGVLFEEIITEGEYVDKMLDNARTALYRSQNSPQTVKMLVDSLVAMRAGLPVYLENKVEQISRIIDQYS